MNRSIARSMIGSGCVALALALLAATAQAQSAPPADPAPKVEQSPTVGAPEVIRRAQMGHLGLKEPAGPLVDINHASRTELKSVPGITTVLAGRIMANRPFGSKTQLVSRNIISRELYGRIRNKVTVRFTKKELMQILGDRAPK